MIEDEILRIFDPETGNDRNNEPGHAAPDGEATVVKALFILCKPESRKRKNMNKLNWEEDHEKKR